ncbi:NAD(P)/FAD-dependent oxidoreductase [Nocardia goodfellowii]|uniref:Geranylgeranyl reductase family protein n=1 Tax=Nocardia goodfellowii TaxID=882446 RepID=A0ABS4QIJ5_9NOCA|nr:geranylgeranyl reductase family protein [Nocardia goodfellowii]MBP2191527.1 geranylgeranyl reductase family protein [Nocardia goodfellowii]
MKKYDIVVVGGGPAGAAAAWQAATAGASVLCVDKADFPRDKPCGDGLTPRGLSMLERMGLTTELERFHRISYVKVRGHSSWQAEWPDRAGLPSFARTARRLDLDQLLLEHAAAAGAEVRQSCEARAPLVERGLVHGVEVRHGRSPSEQIRADIVIAADGAYSPIKKKLGLRTRISGVTAVAIRAEMPAQRPEDPCFEVHMPLRPGGRSIPGYGWVFPLGAGRINVGVGYLTTFRQWRTANLTGMLSDFVATLPPDWRLPDIAELRKSKAVQAWRLPMGFTAWPPWHPGLLLAGDAAGAIKPSSGGGISKALETGMEASICALEALSTTGPQDLSNYQRALRQRYGMQYAATRVGYRVGGNPFMVGLTFGMFDHSWFRRLAIGGVYGPAAVRGYRNGEGPLPSTAADTTQPLAG